VPGDTSELTFARDGIVISRTVRARVTEEAAKWTPGATTLLRLLAGDAVAARGLDDRGAHVSITFTELGGPFVGFALLRCGAIEVLVAPLSEHGAAGIEQAGHPVHERLVRSFDDLLEGTDDELVVKLRNVLLRWPDRH
jgi:hypothetical protein